MPRYAKASQTIDDLKALIRKTAIRGSDDGNLTTYCGGEEHPLWDFFKGKWDIQKMVREDLSKIEVDTENVDYIGEYEMPGTESLESFEIITDGSGNAFPVAWCACGGDWENPLVFVLYIGQKGELRAYIPKDGNVYNKKEKAAYGNNDDDDPSWDDDPDNPLLQFDADKLRTDVGGRIMVKGAIEEKKKNTKACGLTFRQLIQSLKDFEDQYASVMPVAKGAEDPVWGINYIWFENGILNLGQYDDEGDSCDLIAKQIEECVPSDLLDEVAVVRIGITEEVDGKKELYDQYGEVSVSHNVKSSIVEAEAEDDWFCKWILKFT